MPTPSPSVVPNPALIAEQAAAIQASLALTDESNAKLVARPEPESGFEVVRPSDTLKAALEAAEQRGIDAGFQDGLTAASNA